MEAFFKTLKAEELYRNNYRSEREFRERVESYIEFYNSKRPHQINRYRTPDAMEESYYKRHTGSEKKTNRTALVGFVGIHKISHKFWSIPEIAVQLQKIRNGVKSRFLYRFVKTNNTPIEL